MAKSDTIVLWRVLALWAAGIAAAGQFSKLAVILPDIELIYPEAGAALGFVVTLLSLLGIVFGLVAGILAARLGFRRLLLWALALGAILSLYQSTFPPLWIFLIARVGEGASHLAIVVAAPTLIAQITPQRYRPAAMTLWGTFFGVAFALTAWFGLPYVAANGPGALLFGHGIYAGVITVLLYFVLPGGRIATEAASQVLTISSVLRRHAAVYASPSISAPALGWLFYTLTFVSLLTVLPGAVAPEWRVFVASAMPLTGIVISMTVGVIALRFLNAVNVIRGGFLSAIAFASLFFLLPGNPYVCIAVMGALGLVQGASFAAVPQLNTTPDQQALANGAMAQMGNMGNTFGTPAALAVMSVAGFSGLVVFLVCCFGLGALVHSIQANRRHQNIH